VTDKTPDKTATTENVSETRAAPTMALGRIVLVRVHPDTNNGADECPAVVCRVWSADMVNLRVLHDSNAIDWWTSVPVYRDRDAVPKDAPERVAYWGF